MTQWRNKPVPGMDELELRRLLDERHYRAAFERLVAQFQDKIFRLSYAMMRNQAQAEDLTQDALLRIWKGLPGYDCRASVSTWIYAITRNAAFTELKKRASHCALSLDAATLDPSLDQDPALRAHDDPPGSTLDVESCLTRLPEPQRRALTLFYLEQKSYVETAAALGVPLGTAKTLIHRAKARLASLRFAREIHGDSKP